MIVPILGNVNYPITLDPTVWIFDDRKVLLEEAFNAKEEEEIINNDEALRKTAENFDRELDQDFIRPPVNKSINRFEREKILVNSYVMPIKEFLSHAEVKKTAIDVTLVTDHKEIKISLGNLENSLLLFSIKGQPLLEDGPVHLYYQDGSNKENPIKNVKKIIIN